MATSQRLFVLAPEGRHYLVEPLEWWAPDHRVTLSNLFPTGEAYRLICLLRLNCNVQVHIRDWRWITPELIELMNKTLEDQSQDNPLPLRVSCLDVEKWEDQAVHLVRLSFQKGS
jgi:hypothetical protein